MIVKMFQSFLYVSLTSILAYSAYAVAAANSQFEVYVHTNYENQPDLSKYGVKKIGMISAQQFWSKGEDRALLPSKNRVIGHVAGKYASYTGLLAIDIEHWPLIGSDAQVASRVEKFITVWEWVKSAAPKAKIGYYGVVPAPAYWQCQKPASKTCVEWEKNNDRTQALADRVDVLFPNLYSVEANQDNWVRAATAKIREAKRLGKGKPVYLVINPRYHPFAYNNLGYDPIPKDFFRLQLDSTKKGGARGIVIWGWDNANNPWSENLSWWQATKEFLGW